MKQVWILGSAIACIAVLFMWYSMDRPEAKAQPPFGVPINVPASLVGDWEVISSSIMGDSQISTDVMSIGPEASEAFLGGASIQFLSTENGVSKILICGEADKVNMGGGGPRKGICRLNSDGVLEIVEARSPDRDFPADFSQVTLNDSVYSRLSAASSNE